MHEGKRKLSIDEQITHSKEKGIKFELCSEEKARTYLQKNNNYFKLTAYRKNYRKYAEGEKTGQYIDLDFQYLIDLAVLDMELRYLLVHLALDVEHYAKMELIKRVEDSDEDGYRIVAEYIDSLDEARKESFLREIGRNKGNVYCGAIVEKYENNYPIWAFVEIISFGRLVSFYRFCADRFQDKKMQNNYYRLLTCKEIRNASAHNNCILNDLNADSSQHTTNEEVSRALMEIPGVTRKIRLKKMSNARIQQIVTLLYTHKEMVTSQNVYKRECQKINEWIERMYKNEAYYKDNAVVKTSFNFLKLVVDSWYPIAYNKTTEKK